MKTILIVANIVLAALLVIVVTFETVADRERTIQEAYIDADNLARSLSAKTRQRFALLDGATATAAVLVREALAEPPSSDASVHEALVRANERFPEIFIFYFADDQGRLIADSRSAGVDLSSVESLPEFVHHRDDPSLEPFIGTPRLVTTGYARGRWTVTVSKRIEDDAGNFAGVVATALALDELNEFYETLRLPRDSVIGLLSPSGRLLARTPRIVDTLGRDLAGGQIYVAVSAGTKSGRVELQSLDNIPRFSSFIQDPSSELTTYVSISKTSALAPWRQRASLTGILGVILLLVFAFASHFIYRRSLDAQAIERQRIERLRRLAEETENLIRCSSTHELSEQISSASRRLIDVAESHTYLFCSGGLVDLCVRSPASSQRPMHPLLVGDEDRRPAILSGTHPRLIAREVLNASVPQRDSPQFSLPQTQLLYVPIVNRNGTPFGAIALFDPLGRSFNEADVSEVQQLARTASICLENIANIQRLQAALEAAHFAQEQVQTIFSSISDAVVAVDTECRLTFLNAEAEAISGVKREDVIGRHVLEDYDLFKGSPVEAGLIAALQRRERVDVDYYFEPRKRWLSGRIFPSETGATLYLHDVTAQVEAEERLRQSQRLDAIGQLTGGIAHDFNNLLTVVLGSADVAHTLIGEDNPVRQQIDTIRMAGERAAELTHRLLAFARRQPLDPRPIDSSSLVDNMGPLLTRVLGETIDIETISSPDLWKAVADPHELENALLNLAINSRDAMPDGGKLTIETANVTLDEVYAGSNDIDPGRYVLIAVSDTGSGMDAATLKRVFEPFFTTKKTGSGSGLGLSMVFGFIKQSGGHIRVYSEPGQGTTVRMYLPRAIGDETQQSNRQQAVPIPTGEEIILVVEDDDLVRSHTVSSLQSLGYRVVACSDGNEAVAKVRDGQKFDLLLTDVVLPGNMSGKAVASEIATIVDNPKILYMSGYTENSIVHHGRLDAGVQLLSKPFRLGDLARKVRQVLDS